MRSHGRQMNMDYSLYWALRYRMARIRRVIFFYDLMCQYWRNLMLRFRGNPFLSWPEGLEMVWAISLFHVHGHVDQCYAWFAPTFIPGAGQVDGEILETLWSVLNISSPVTRRQTAANRQETLDDHMNDSNWKKIIGIGEACLSTFINTFS